MDEYGGFNNNDVKQITTKLKSLNIQLTNEEIDNIIFRLRPIAQRWRQLFAAISFPIGHRVSKQRIIL